MKARNGFMFPDYDVECGDVTFHQSKDMDRAIKHCEETKCVIQAGGNVGVWAVRLSETFDVVHTFEPDDENYECLWLNTQANDNIYIHNAALGPKMSEASIQKVEKNCGANHIKEGNDFKVVTIDSLDLKPDLIILDIEGYEELAIIGGLTTILDYKPVIMYEDKDLSIPYTGHGKGYIEKWMTKYGYVLTDKVHRDVILTCPQQ